MVKSLGAVVVVLLGLAWFLLDALGPPAQQPGAVPATMPPPAPFSEPGSVSKSGQVSLRPQKSVPATPAPGKAAPRVESPVRGTPVEADAVERGARLQDAFAEVEDLRKAGDLEGAETRLREIVADQSRPAEAARAGLLLASLTSDPAEQRLLITVALREQVVIGGEYEQVSEVLRGLNQDPASSLLPHLEVDTYEVQPGDSLWALCNKVFPQEFGSAHEVGLLRLVNGMRGDTLRVGQTLVVPRGEVSIQVDATQHGLTAFLGDVALMAYRVGLGRQNRTPRGDFQVKVKQENPAWWKDGEVVPFGDPENVLGTRWMGFENRPGTSGYGIHGTDDPSSVGKDMSMGCVRMRNVEVQELFEYVPRGTQVAIR